MGFADQIWQILLEIVTVSAVLVGIYFSWRTRQENELRKNEVLQWTYDVIDSTNRIENLIKFSQKNIEIVNLEEKIIEESIKISSLIEKGRMHFSNTNHKYKMEKSSAYTGYRPIVLDQPLAIYFISKAFLVKRITDKNIVKIMISNYKKEFVSLMRQEVGRNKISSHTLSSAGRKIDLSTISSEYDEIQSQENTST